VPAHAGQGGTKQVIGSRAGGQHPRRSPPQQPLRDPLLEGITQIRENVHLAEAPSHHEPITMSEPYSTGAADYRELAHELMKGGR
jgi:cellulose biosynthesis protein BcsQ